MQASGKDVVANGSQAKAKNYAKQWNTVGQGTSCPSPPAAERHIRYLVGMFFWQEGFFARIVRK